MLEDDSSMKKRRVSEGDSDRRAALIVCNVF